MQHTFLKTYVDNVYRRSFRDLAFLRGVLSAIAVPFFSSSFLSLSLSISLGLIPLAAVPFLVGLGFIGWESGRVDAKIGKRKSNKNPKQRLLSSPVRLGRP